MCAQYEHRIPPGHSESLNKNYNSDKSVRRSSRRSKLPEYLTTECIGVPKWMLRRSSPNSVSLSSNGTARPSRTGCVQEIVTPFLFKLPTNQVPFPVPIRILISVSYKSDQVIRVERFPVPVGSTSTAVTGFRHHRNEESQFRHSEKSFPRSSGLLTNVEGEGVKPNVIDAKPLPSRPRKRRRRINVATAVTTLSGRPLPRRPRYSGRAVYSRMELKRRKLNDYPEAVAQLEELAAVRLATHETEREIKNLEKRISVAEGMIANKDFLDFENWLKSEVYFTGYRTEQYDEAKILPSPTISEIKGENEIFDGMIDGIPTFDCEE